MPQFNYVFHEVSAFWNSASWTQSRSLSIFPPTLSPFCVLQFSLFHYLHTFPLSPLLTSSPLLSSMCPTFPILVSFPVLYVSKPTQLSSSCSLPLISPLLQVFTLTGGAAAGQLCPCVRGGNHRGDVWCSAAGWWGAGPIHPGLSKMTMFAWPLSWTQTLLGKRASGTAADCTVSCSYTASVLSHCEYVLKHPTVELGLHILNIFIEFLFFSVEPEQWFGNEDMIWIKVPP